MSSVHTMQDFDEHEGDYYTSPRTGGNSINNRSRNSGKGRMPPPGPQHVVTALVDYRSLQEQDEAQQLFKKKTQEKRIWLSRMVLQSAKRVPLSQEETSRYQKLLCSAPIRPAEHFTPLHFAHAEHPDDDEVAISKDLYERRAAELSSIELRDLHLWGPVTRSYLVDVVKASRMNKHAVEKKWFEDNGWWQVDALCIAERHSCSHGVPCSESRKQNGTGYISWCRHDAERNDCRAIRCKYAHKSLLDAVASAFVREGMIYDHANELAIRWKKLHMWFMPPEEYHKPITRDYGTSVLWNAKQLPPAGSGLWLSRRRSLHDRRVVDGHGFSAHTPEEKAKADTWTKALTSMPDYHDAKLQQADYEKKAEASWLKLVEKYVPDFKAAPATTKEVPEWLCYANFECTRAEVMQKWPGMYAIRKCAFNVWRNTKRNSKKLDKLMDKRQGLALPSDEFSDESSNESSDDSAHKYLLSPACHK